MKITTPEEKENQINEEVEQFVEKFEQELSKEYASDYHLLSIYEELNEIQCEAIVKLYTKAGWKRVECKSFISKGNDSHETELKLYKNDNY